MVDHGQHPTIMYELYNVFLVYNVSIDLSKAFDMR